MESKEIDLYTYDQLIVNKNAKTIQWKKDTLTNSAGTIRYPYAKQTKKQNKTKQKVIKDDSLEMTAMLEILDKNFKSAIPKRS